jgi:tRNA1(Val) A37 N6-methylase TrmN6
MFLVEMVKGRKADTRILPPLFVYDADGEYSQEMNGIFGEKESSE